MSLLNTRLQDVRVQSPDLSRWTLRPSRYGAFDAFISGNNEPQSIISQDVLDRAATAVGRDVQIPVFDAEDVTIGNTRSVTIADSENTSQLYTVSFTTYSWGFTMVPSLYMNNSVSEQADFQRKYLKYFYKFASGLDAACVAALSFNKSQVFADLLGIYSNVGNAMVAANPRREEFIGDLSPVMKANDFYGAPYHVIGNSGLESRIMKLNEKGLYNQENKVIQFNDKQFHFTNRIPNESGNVATGYCVNPGSLGMLFRHEREALLGTQLPDGTEWRVDRLPGLDIPIDTFFYYGKGDYSAIGGASSADMTRVAKEHYGFAIEIALVVTYNTDPSVHASPIIKFVLAAA